MRTLSATAGPDEHPAEQVTPLTRAEADAWAAIWREAPVSVTPVDGDPLARWITEAGQAARAERAGGAR